jgi:hypothetical protein
MFESFSGVAKWVFRGVLDYFCWIVKMEAVQGLGS